MKRFILAAILAIPISKFDLAFTAVFIVGIGCGWMLNDIADGNKFYNRLCGRNDKS